jgi:IS5 family transposase
LHKAKSPPLEDVPLATFSRIGWCARHCRVAVLWLHASIWRFRQTIDKLGLSTKLLAEVNRQLEALGLVIKRGTLVDATLIAGAVRRP